MSRGMPPKILHVLSGLAIGGMERAVIRLAFRGKREGMDHALLLFDSSFRSDALDFDPSGLVTEFVERRPGVDLRFVVELARRFSRSQPDVIHAHNNTAIFYSALAMVIGHVARTRLIGTFRTRPIHLTAGARLATRWAAGQAAEIVAVSGELSEWLIRHGWVSKCPTIWNGADLTEFFPEGPVGPWRERFGIPNNAIVVGHVGRFAAIKRHADLFEAAARLTTFDPPIYFLLAGDGPLLELFRGQAAQLTNVFLLSNIGDVASFLRALDIFVLCSEHEGAPQALLEAMACERAIIATSVGGVPHLLGADGHTPAGRLIPPRRPDRLAEEIVCLARDGALRNCLAQQAFRQAQLFSFEREWTQYATLYSASCAHSSSVTTVTGSTG